MNLTGPGTTPTLGDPFWNSEHEWDIIALDSPSMNLSSFAFTNLENGTFADGSFSTIVDTSQTGYGNAGDILLVWNPSMLATAVPEPSSWCLLLIGASVWAVAAWRQGSGRTTREPAAVLLTLANDSRVS